MQHKHTPHPEDSDFQLASQKLPTGEYYWITISTMELYRIMHSDLTSQFPFESSSGHQYILVVYNYNSNSILVEPMKNHSDMEMVQTYTTMSSCQQHAGFNPIIQCLDNEASTALKTWMCDCNIQFQLVLPHVHHCNAVVQAI